MAKTERSRQVRDRRQPRNFQEAKDRSYYYREEYGWLMNDDDVAEEQRVKAEVYDPNIQTVKDQIANAESQYATSRANGISDINSQYDRALSSVGGNTTRVRVVNNGSNVEATYTVPTSFAREYANSDRLYTSWHNNNRVLNVDVRARGGRTVGQEIHDSLRDAQNQYNTAVRAQRSNIESERRAAINTFNENTDAQLAGQREVWNASLMEAENAYPNRVATGAENYRKSRQAYNDSITNMDLGLLETPTNQVNTGGNNG